MNFKLKSLFLFCFILSCNEAERLSSVDDVSLTGKNGKHLIWVEGEMAYKGLCTEGELALRAYCSEKINIQPSETIQSRVEKSLTNETDETTIKIDIETQRLIDKDPSVQRLTKRILNLQKHIDELNTSIEIYTRQTADATQVLDVKTVKREGYERQITAIDSELETNPEDKELLDLKDALSAELAPILLAIQNLESFIENSIRYRESDQVLLDSATNELALKIDELESTKYSLTPWSIELDTLNSELDELLEEMKQLDSLFNMLERSAISYRTELLTPAKQSLMLRVNSSFIDMTFARIEGGIFQVKHSGQWRGVCEDGFNEAAAQVSCHMMGQSLVSFAVGRVGTNSAFWLDNLDCDGTENSLFECTYGSIGSHNCNANKHVAVTCE